MLDLGDRFIIDPENDPTYPMRHRENEDTKSYDWDRPTQQRSVEEVMHSIERPNLTAVYGTVTPPRGLSGVIRRLAFKDSENSYLHWLPLLMADRVDVIEGVIDDLLHGKLPNTFAEKGGKARWEHDKKAVITNVVIGAVLVGGLVAYLATRNSRDDSDNYYRKDTF